MDATRRKPLGTSQTNSLRYNPPSQRELRIADSKTMKTILMTFALLLASVTSACSGSGAAQNVNPNLKATDSPQARASDQQNLAPGDQELQRQIAQIASAARGHVGVAAVVLETGEVVSLHL